jgi:propanol-preferring alcohol dehydrogenase
VRAAVLEEFNQPIAIRDVPDPSVGPRDVLIRVEAAAICHTDLDAAAGAMASVGIRGPLIMGHETTGVVEQVGAEVSHIAPGRRVGVFFTLGCGHCRACTDGEEESCLGGAQTIGFQRPGGYAEYIAVPASVAVPLPDELDGVSAAPLFCGGLTAYAALKNAQLRPGERVAVLGVGGLGHLALAIARALGAEVVALTSTESKVELARQMGAHHVLVGAELGRQLAEMGGADVIISTTIDSAPLASVYAGLRPLGRMVLTGVTPEPLSISPMALILNQHKIIGSFAGSRADLLSLLSLAASHNIRPMTERFLLDGVNDAYARVRRNQVRFRAVLSPR